MLKLLFTRRFLAFFVCQFCGAFNDNLFRLSLVAMLSFGALKSDSSSVFIQLSAGVFMLPFFLFSAAAGDLTDQLSKRRLLVTIKSAEVLIMSLAAAGVYLQSVPLLMISLLLTGTQSAFFGPIKFSLLPALLKRDELIDGNAWFSVSTFAAILGGTALGTLGGQSPQYALYICGGIVLLSLLGLAAALLTPAPDEPAAPAKAAFRPLRAFKTVFSAACENRFVFRCLLAGSWFWLAGVLLLNELALLPYTLYTHALAAVFAGVGAGAVLCRWIYRGRITTKHAPALLLASGALLFCISRLYAPAADALSPPLAAVISLYCAVMTLYVVPLRTTIQASCAPEHRAKIIAAYNIFNALFIVIATLAAAGIHGGGGGAEASRGILLFTSLLSLAAALFALSILPVESLRRLLAPLCRRLFRVQVRGLEHLKDDEKTTLICNHQSFLDGVLLAVFLQNERRRLGFPIHTEQTKNFFARQALKLVRHYPLNPIDPKAVRALIRDVQHSEENITPLIFPEGRITTTGGIMKSYPGAGVIAEKISGGRITPVIIDGAQYSTLSRMQGKLALRRFPAITIDILPPAQISAPAHLHGQQKRQVLSQQMGQLLEQSLFQVRRRSLGNITAAFAAAARRHGASAPLFAELPQRRLSCRQTYTAAAALGALLCREHAPGHRIGLLLPSSVGAAVCFYAAVFQRLTPVMLNPGSGAAQVLTACRTAELGAVYTARALLERAPAAAQITEALAGAGIRVILLEDLRAQITLPIKLKAAASGLFMQTSARRLPGAAAAADEHAAVLFTSGSEGAAKGVALTHANLLANSAQVLTRLPVTGEDIMLNALPVFHSFGLLAGVILPVTAGVETWQYPTPLHYKIIPEVLYGVNATVFFSANTFLKQYGNAAAPLDFHSLKMVFAGAEKLRDDTRRLWQNKFGIRILEGYGVTETSPALSVNSPLYHRAGTVGRLLPGVQARLEPVADVERGGRLHVRGDNIMAGYFTADAPGALKPPPGGWHDTGDIADIDEDGYVTIIGRARRFIKVAGEMVPLDKVEECLKQHGCGEFAVVGVADDKRGESLALMTTAAVRRADIGALLQKAGLPELWQPRHIKVVAQLPLLPTGKVDYPAVSRAFAGGQLLA